MLRAKRYAVNERVLRCFEGLEENQRKAAAVPQLHSDEKRLLNFDPNIIEFSGQLIEFNELNLGDNMGKGGFADVHVAVWKNDIVAVKKLRVNRNSQATKNEFENEIQLLSTLNHPSIVTFYGACVKTPNLAIVMEFIPKGSLHKVLRKSVQLTKRQKSSMIYDLLTALDYIHERKIAHRDIKSANILVCENLRNCKLSDFGIAVRESRLQLPPTVFYSLVR